MATVTVKQLMKVALVADEEELRALDRIIRSFVPNARIEATTADGVVHKLDGIEELLQLPNSSDETISELSWMGHDLNTGKTIIVRIDSDSSIRNVHFSFESSDGSEARELTRQLRTWLRENRAAYGWIAERDMFVVVLIAWVVLYSGLTVWVKINPSPPSKSNDAPLTITQAIVVVTFWLWPIAIGWILHKLKPFAFPVLALQIGHGKKRYQRASTIRNGVLLALVVGVVGSVIAAKFFP